jgi:hypothetical protein
MAKRELADSAAQLYGMPFDDFVAGRNAAAKELLSATPATPELRSRAAEVRSLPKPSVSAWAVNMLAWRRPETIRDLAELGLAMRRAQASLDAATLRSLSRERRTMLAGAVDAARAVAEQQGRKISGTVAAEVEQTLRAATADKGAAAAVRSGRLLRTLSADGVDVVDLDGAVAVPDATGARPPAAPPENAASPAPGTPPATGQPRLRAVRQERPAPSPSARERAQAALRQATDAALSSAAEAERASGELEDATDAAAALTEEAAGLREQLARAEAGLRQARKRLELASAAAQQAARTAEKDRRREDLVRERVRRLGNTPGG